MVGGGWWVVGGGWWVVGGGWWWWWCGVAVLRVGDALLVGVEKRAPHGFQSLHWPLLKARWIEGSTAYLHYFPKEDTKRKTQQV